jgi:hypothetical protein
MTSGITDIPGTNNKRAKMNPAADKWKFIRQSVVLLTE